jgi:AraC-like DNA-binding protein
MGAQAADFAPLRFSTRDVPERDRLPFWRDFFARKVLLADIEPLSRGPLEAEATLLAWPGLQAGWFHVPTPMRHWRTPAMVAEGDDSFAFFVKETGGWEMSQRGRDLSLGKGDAAGVLNGEPARKTISRVASVAIFVPLAALAPLVGDAAAAAMKVVPAGNGPLRLLKNYLGILREDPAIMTPELRQAATAHIYDLIALALGATRDGAAIVQDRGLRAARLTAIKADILKHLSSRDLTVSAIARQHGITPRYVHLLFESEGVTFSEFVLAQRLVRARQMLLHPRFASASITDIAYEAGFGDLSYFNRTFRRQFGATPSELRARAGLPRQRS